MNDILIVVLVFLLYFSPVFYHLFFLLKNNEQGDKKLSLKKFFKFLKYSFFTLIITFIVLGVLSHTNYFNYEKPFTFDRYNEITFENFRGLEFLKKSLYGNNRFAYVVTTIDSNISENSVIIQSLFHPSRSFVYNRNTNSKELLSHEKYHIKITELFVRKAKEEISKLNSFDEIKIKKIIHKAEIDEIEFQRKYDYDTFHSYVLGEQKKYEKEIDSLLTLLVKFKNPKIIIHENQ